MDDAGFGLAFANAIRHNDPLWIAYGRSHSRSNSILAAQGVTIPWAVFHVPHSTFCRGKIRTVRVRAGGVAGSPGITFWEKAGVFSFAVSIRYGEATDFARGV